MRKIHWLLGRGLACGLALFLSAFVLAAEDKPSKTSADKEPADPPGTTQYMSQFRLMFDAWDLNKDGYLDKEELAKAFRGPRAKPYDYVAPPRTSATKDDKDDPKKDDPKKDEPKKDEPKKEEPKKEEPQKADPKDSDSEKNKSSSEATTKKKPNYSKYPDYNFLVQLDTDQDEQISRKEFMSWARDMATQMKQQHDEMQKIAQLQQQLAKAKSGSAEYKKLQSQLNKETAAMNKMAGQMKGYETQMMAMENKQMQQLQHFLQQQQKHANPKPKK